MTNLKFAVMGTGFWANFQIPAWFEVGGVELVALYNRTRSRAEAMAAKCVSDWRAPNTPRVYDDPDELFRREQARFRGHHHRGAGPRAVGAPGGQPSRAGHLPEADGVRL